MKRKIVPVSLFAAFWLSALMPARADIVTLNGGTTYQGIVVQKDDKELLLLRDYGTQWIPASMVKSVKLDEKTRPSTAVESNPANPVLLPTWGQIVMKAARTSWGDKLRQIPATVIDKGVLKNVPYISFKCGNEYELNIYGDLEKPSGVEVGIYGSLIGKDHAQKNAVEFIASLLPFESDRQSLKTLSPGGSQLVRGSLTLETTPPSHEDAYGGWWVSVYSIDALNSARASDSELQAITVVNNSGINTNAVAPWLATLRAPAVATPPATQSRTGVTTYTAPSPSYVGGYVPSYVAPSTRGSGPVYVNGYYRKNGTYVHSYTRSR